MKKTIILTEKVKNQEAYENWFPEVKIIKDKDYYVINAQTDEKKYTTNFITKQPTIKCLEAWFEGVVKGHCKPRTMFGREEVI